MLFNLPDLPYSYDKLEPYIDSETMKIHHQKHHGGYVNKLNNLLEKEGKKVESIEELMQNISDFPAAVRNNGGGHFNHSFFWKILGPGCGGEPKDELAFALQESFGSIEGFRRQFTEAALSRFGSGWAWLIQQDSRLIITSTPNQDNPVMNTALEPGIPLMGLDVWEHAYYLNYQNQRNKYIDAFWSVVNWNEVQKNHQLALQEQVENR
jgi:Fe-Mn family superoxide dismutase